MPRSFARPANPSRPISDNAAVEAHAPILHRQQVRRNLLAHAGTIGLGQSQFANIGGQATKQEPLIGNCGKAADLYQNSLEAVRKGSVDVALNLIIRACSLADATGECYRLYAHLLWRQENRNAAICIARNWVERDGNDAQAWDFLGELLAEQNEFTQSKLCYERAIELDPSLLSSAHNLATTLLRLGYVKEAESRYRDILERVPDHLDARLNLACLLNGAGRYQEALASIEDLLASNPKLNKACVIASAVEYNLERYQRALIWIEEAIALAPDQIKLLTRRAEIIAKLGNNDLALAECDRVLSIFPDNIEALRVKACALRYLNRPAEALETLLLAESRTSDTANLAVDRAWLLGELGRKDDALQLLDRILSERPDFVAALDCRSFLSRPKPGHPHVAAMEDIVGKSELPIIDRIRLSLSIGRIYLDAGEGEKAFHHLNFGNGLKRSTITYDRALEERWFSAIMELFSAEHMPHLPSNSTCSSQPIFVFGMPRSGTTLVEQILASHPIVRGTGETPHLDTLARSSVFAHGLCADKLACCANDYLKLVSAGTPEAMRFVDKTNSNFLYAGLISLMLPNARMIHCRRDPLDTCLSCYALLFAHGHEFSYDLSELGHYYRLYQQIMAHWRNILPAEKLLEVDYETLVSDTEGQIRRILDFCGLPWNDACLHFHETNRLVTTSSFDQVRSPIYKSSVGRAQMFRSWLGPLDNELAVSR